MGMGRGKAFNHKRKGHENQPPKYATNDPEFSSEPLQGQKDNNNKEQQ
ncbi:hypothetical protein [Calidifontibacillus erzurumensis]|nr:hypothetical protein [Calidifontibacillus erzurumensis]